jgi:hypothetical protein
MGRGSFHPGQLRQSPTKPRSPKYRPSRQGSLAERIAPKAHISRDKVAANCNLLKRSTLKAR